MGMRKLRRDTNEIKNKIAKEIAGILQVQPSEISQIRMIKKGMTNQSLLFEYKGEQYIIRIPGKGTECLINRRWEYEVYSAIREKGICDEIYYIDENNGYKVTKYIENAKNCDPYNWEDVEKCMCKLRNVHEQHIEVNHTFDIFSQIEYYEELRMDKSSIYADYKETKENIWQLKAYIDEQTKKWGLTHMDAVPDNFLLYTNGRGEEQIRLIDWEYAAMQDVHIDIAMFAIYAMYDKKNIDKLMDLYFTEGCDRSLRKKIYAYIAVCGLLWSNWCEYKRDVGIELGEYSERQYCYAKEYYCIWKGEKE